MKYLLLAVIVFSLLTVFELQREYKKNQLSKVTLAVISTAEVISALISLLLLFKL